MGGGPCKAGAIGVRGTGSGLVYGESTEPQKRYSPAECIGVKLVPMISNPDPDQIGTSYVERNKLSVRMTNRRYSRLTNAFSKKIENHSAAVATRILRV
jgi:hypothetical protein